MGYRRHALHFPTPSERLSGSTVKATISSIGHANLLYGSEGGPATNSTMAELDFTQSIMHAQAKHLPPPLAPSVTAGLPPPHLPVSSPFLVSRPFRSLVRSFVGVGAAAFPFALTCSPPHPNFFCSFCFGRLVGCWRVAKPHNAHPFAFPFPSTDLSPLSTLPLLSPLLCLSPCDRSQTSPLRLLHLSLSTPNLPSKSPCISHRSLPDFGSSVFTA